MQVTIGLSPSSRHIGIAVLHKDQLIAWRIQTFPGKWSEAKQRAILQALRLLFASYNVEALSVKIPVEFPKTVTYSQLIGLINRHCESYGMKASYYTLSDIKRRFSLEAAGTKNVIFSLLAHKYPELCLAYSKHLKQRDRYHSRLLEAIAVGICDGDNQCFA
jgi:hypothetical protein